MEITAIAKSYSAGRSPGTKVTAPLIPVLIRGNAHIRCLCTWGCTERGKLYLRWYSGACEVWKRGGHE